MSKTSQLARHTTYAVGHLTPSIVLYEPSFEGWLSAVFYIYENRLQDDEATTDRSGLLRTFINSSSS